MKIEDEMGLETFHLFLPLPLPQAPGQVPCQGIKILPRALPRLAPAMPLPLSGVLSLYSRPKAM